MPFASGKSPMLLRVKCKPFSKLMQKHIAVTVDISMFRVLIAGFIFASGVTGFNRENLNDREGQPANTF